MKESPKAKIHSTCKSLEARRESFESHWQDIADHTFPRSYRWLDQDWTSRGNKYNKKILDPVATLSCRAMVAAFSTGITSPSRPWKKLSTTNPAFRDDYEVKTYLAESDEILDEIILKSNFYQEASKLYEQTALFGTGAMLIEEDAKETFRCETLPCGSYYLGCDYSRRVNQFYRKIDMTAAQIVAKFGEENISGKVRDAYKSDTQRNKTVFCVHHYVGPNDEYDDSKIDKPFKSCYYEYSGNADDTGFLRESGYDEFPVIAPRWKVYGDDVYGLDSPGISILGAIKRVQHIQKQIMKAAEKQVNPPVLVPESSRRQTIETFAGSVTYTDDRGAGSGPRPFYQVNFDIQASQMLVDDCRNQIREAFFYNLFLMVANERRSGTKAREIDELHEEKMLMLSTVYEQFSQEFLDPAVARIYAIANRAGKLPEPPPQFQGVEFSVEYVSVMAQAMKLVGIGNMDRAMATLGQIATVKPEVLDLINGDRFAGDILDRLGVDPRDRNSPSEIDSIRQARQAQQAQAAQTQQMAVEADTAKVLSDTKTGTDSALDALVNQARGIQ